MCLNKRMRDGEKGQVALILVLVLTVVSAVALSALSGIVTNIRITGVDEESSQALRVAEAGVEQALRTLSSQSTTSFNGVTYNVGVQQEGINGFVSEQDVAEGDVVEVNLMSVSNRPTSIDIYWQNTGDSVDSPAGAIEITRYRWQATNNIQTVTTTFDPSGTRAASNGFTVPSGTPGSFQGVSFGNKTTVALDWRDRLVRIRVLYNQQKVGVGVNPSTASFAVNPYSRVTSTANTTSGVTRKVQAVRVQGSLPTMFDSALYSGGSLSK
jgi:Tfp pilus assembly protein PilX